MLYQQQVIETRTYDCVYTVEANNIEEAKNKIASGETVYEDTIKLTAVISRDEWDEPIPIPIPPNELRRAIADAKPSDVRELGDYISAYFEEELDNGQCWDQVDYGQALEAFGGGAE